MPVAVASVLPFLVVLSSIAMVTAGVHELTAGVTAFFASVLLLCLIVPAVFLARRVSSRILRIGVFLVAGAEFVGAVIARYGIKYGWWAP